MLSDQAIKTAIRNQELYAAACIDNRQPDYIEYLQVKPRIVIEPYCESQMNPNSYNLRLGDKLLVYAEDSLDMAKDNPTQELTIPEEGLVLEPGRLYLGSTIEHTETYNLAPFIEGRSSIGRLGAQVHLTAGFGDNFHKGTWTLEITVVHALRVYAGVEVCQIGYAPITGVTNSEYKGKYQDQTGPRASQLWKDFQKKK